MFRIDEPIFEDGERSDNFDEYVDTLLEQFAASPEAKPIIESGEGLGCAHMMINYAADHLGESPATMSLANFDEILFELFPRKVSIKPERAPAIVTELKAFWQFLDRQYGLKNAREIAATLGPDAASRLEEELANPANYGMAKSFFMAGQKAGFDMTTEEGLAAFQLRFNSQLLNNRTMPNVPRPFGPFLETDLSPSGLSPKQRAERRKAKKRQREARKRNRK